MKLEDIKDHWEKSRKDFPVDGSVTPTSRDPYLGQLERANFLSSLSPELTCLELGCGDGYHTVHYAKEVKKLSGVDVAASLIDLADQRIHESHIENVDLSVVSVLDIAQQFEAQSFDCILSQRCLINLPDWEYQKNAISQAHQLLKTGGLFLLSEGFQENLDNLNAVRKLVSLPEIKVVDYNRNFLMEDFEEYILQYFDIVEKRGYGSYLFFSRIYHPLVVFPENPKHDSKLNEIAMKLSSLLPMQDLERYSYNLFYVLKKK